MASPLARGVGLALLAAACFGLVNVTVKQSTMDPVALAGFTYLLAGLVLAPSLRGVRVARGDLWRVLAMSFLGAFAAPVALYVGLRHANAADASLLLTMEMAFTALLAALVLRERVRGRGALGMLLLLAAALVVAGAGLLGPREGHGTTALGIGLVLLSTLGWSLDNLVSTHLTWRYALRPLLAAKGLVGGAACLAVAFALAPPGTPTARNLLEVAFIGLVGITASGLVFYRSLQLMGATRTTGVFVPATALSGAAGGFLLLGEPLGWPHLAAAALMLAGVGLLSTSALGADDAPRG